MFCRAGRVLLMKVKNSGTYFWQVELLVLKSCEPVCTLGQLGICYGVRL